MCSTVIDCSYTYRHKLLDTQRSVTSYTVVMKEPNIGQSSGSAYTHLLLTSAKFLHNKPIYNLLSISYCKQCDLKLYLLRTAELQDIYILLFDD
jgi:hypothetical protein